MTDTATPVPDAAPTAPYLAELESGPVVDAPADPSPLFVLRHGRETDRAWIAKTWVETNKGTPLAAALGPLYAARHMDCVWRLLARTDVDVVIAADPSEPDAILGFLVRSASAFASGGAPAVHYVHVRKDMRRLGIGRALVDGLVARACTFSAQVSDATDRRGGAAVRDAIVPPSWRYDPYALFVMFEAPR